MKKGWKIFAIVCAVVAGIGIILCIAGFAIGATTQEVRVALNRGIGFGPDFNYTHHTKVVTDKPEQDVSGVGFHNVRSIELDVGAVQVEILPTDEEEIRVEHDVDNKLKIRCIQNGDILKIRTTGRITKSNHGGMIQIYIPRDLVLREAELDIGAGALKVTDFRSNELNISCGAAAVHMVNIEANDVDIECGAGQIEYIVKGQENDYNYDVEIGAGEVSIGEDSFSGLAVDKKINNNADKNMSIECGAGQVAVTFVQQN